MGSRGLFITFEGGEGSGKTTQIKKLAEALRARGHEVVTTREPGGTPEAEKIRNLLSEDDNNWTPMAEMFLLFAGRVLHVNNLIKPALAAGKIVISDRFTDSTRAYQCYAEGLDLQIIETINQLSLQGFEPDLTFILDLPVEQGKARTVKRAAQGEQKEDRYDRLAMEFHERLRQGYLAIARNEPKRCIVINADRSVDLIAEELVGIVEQSL